MDTNEIVLTSNLLLIFLHNCFQNHLYFKHKENRENCFAKYMLYALIGLNIGITIGINLAVHNVYVQISSILVLFLMNVYYVWAFFDNQPYFYGLYKRLNYCFIGTLYFITAGSIVIHHLS